MDSLRLLAGAETELQALLETNEAVRDQIQKDLAQEYVRFMSRMLREQLANRGVSKFQSEKGAS